MIADVARPQRLPFPTSKRSQRRAKKYRHKTPRRGLGTRVPPDVRAADERERAYFAGFPSSVYPGTIRPHRHLRFHPDLQRIWLRSFERWQKIRERFIRFHSRNVDDRVMIHAHSLFYRDMRYWECRRCGWDANNRYTWSWWTKLDLVQRMAFIEASRQKGMYFTNRRAWQQARAAA